MNHNSIENILEEAHSSPTVFKKRYFSKITEDTSLENEASSSQDNVREHVDPKYIKKQRSLGWPDIHPEDYCHICGQANEIWYVDHNIWQIVTAEWQAETGREGICCMPCFCDMMKEKAGQQVAVELRIDTEYLFRKLPHMEYLVDNVGYRLDHLKENI